MPEDVSKHPKKVTLNLTEEDYFNLLELSDKAEEAPATVAKKLFLDGLDKFKNPEKMAFSKMRG